MAFRPDQPETVFTYGAPGLKFGVGARHEIGFDLGQLGARRVLIVTDPGVAATGAPAEIAETLKACGIESVVFDRSRVEPTDASMIEAIEFGRSEGPFDAIVAVGGGSSIDTAKAVNLLTTNEGELMDYINAPVGKAKPPTAPLLPLIAVPTTTGTGSESTTICVLDVVSQHVKTGISHARLRPTLAVVDPELTLSQPAGVTAAAGLDILCHALESYTARPYESYEHKTADQRVPYCGSNPIADMWSEKALSAHGVVISYSGPRRRQPGCPHRGRDGRDLRRSRLRQRRRPHPARQRLSDRRTGTRLPPRRLRRRSCDGSARHGGVAHRAGSLQVHVRCLAGSSRTCGRAAGSRCDTARRRRRLPSRRC